MANAQAVEFKRSASCHEEFLGSELSNMNPPDALTSEERALVDRYWDFYVALATGQRKATTHAQQHFIDVAHGHTACETPHERAFLKQVALDRYRRSLDRRDSDVWPDNSREGRFW